MTGNDVAVKCLTKSAASSAVSLPQAVDDRSEEVACHMALKHPNLVNLLHHFETDAHVYLVLEYCSMGDLYEAIRQEKGPLETEHVRTFMLQLVNAVDYMHVHGLAHRDIKPENIFLTQDGSMKLGDFGLATKALWSYDACVGSDRYMAPEQYDPAATGYSPAQADIWSLGICLLNVLFSRNPFMTPTESDVLFADYRRDRQSLFDIFPNMSQDTFEVLSHALAIDPSKRSLAAVRESLMRAVTFTTDDEPLDLFCAEERDIVRASANREPLRTPSIQSPQIAQGDSFPWAKALQSSPPQAMRQLSAIPDSEILDEDLFAASEKDTGSWFSAKNNTPSVASVLDAASYKSISLKQPKPRMPASSDVVPFATSLPTKGTRPRPIPSMSTIFGKKNDTVSKSWSEMWEEEESENEDARNSGSSQTTPDDDTVRPGVLTESKSNSNSKPLRSAPKSVPMQFPKSLGYADENSHNWGGRFRSGKRSPTKPPSSDMWAALGNKRRNYQPANEDKTGGRKRSMTTNWRREGVTGSSGFDYGAWNRKGSHGANGRRAYLDHDWRHAAQAQATASGYDGALEDDEHEWVGGWHAFHL
ncbi:MAG: hypothetical protein Q9227_006353 [Pyrenula ochraceoflavens]